MKDRYGTREQHRPGNDAHDSFGVNHESSRGSVLQSRAQLAPAGKRVDKHDTWADACRRSCNALHSGQFTAHSPFAPAPEAVGFKVGDYKRGSAEGGTSAQFKGSQAVRLDACGAGTMHTGALGHSSSDLSHGAPSSLFDSATAPLAMIEPWWAPARWCR